MNKITGKLGAFMTLIIILLSTLFVFTSCGSQNPRSQDRAKEKEGWIGVYVQDLDEELRDYLDIRERSGVLVNEVEEGSPAEEAGLEEEDVIIRFDGKRIRNTKDLTRAVRRKDPGDGVKIEIIRNGEKKKITLEVGDRPRKFYSRSFRDRAPAFFGFRGFRKPWLGIRMVELNENLAEYFNADKRDGVLILSVEEDSPAEKAGLKAGDILIEIDEERVRDPEDVSEIIEDREIGDEVEIKIIRRGNKTTVKAELKRAPRGFSFSFDKDGFRDLRDEMREWKNEFSRNRLHDFTDKIKYELHEEIKQLVEEIIKSETGMDKLEKELEKLEDQLGREMARIEDELQNNIKKLQFELLINDLNASI